MHAPKADDPPPEDDDESDVLLADSPSAKADRYGLGLSLSVLGVALVLMVISFISEPSFAKCSVLATEPDRMSCYQKLRDELLRSPAKGVSDAALERTGR
jgi:hypothetical protein